MRLPRRRKTLLTLIGVLVVGVVSALLTLPSQALLGSVDRFARYAPATHCDPSPKPGTTALAQWLVFSYPGTGSAGISRPCGNGGASEHKEGRAFDWKVNYADALQREQAEDFLHQLLATDADGNKYALARRMGVMYVIWNERIFALYKPGWRPYRGASPHRDHVHISLTPEGAAGRTSWYKTGTGPRLSPQARTSVPVPTTREVATPFSLVKGGKYRLVVSGTYRRSAGGVLADAECSQAGARWVDAPAVNPGGRVLDLTVNRAGNWKPRSGTGVCDPKHVYYWDYTPTRSGPLTLSVRDVVASNNVGTLRLHVVPRGASLARF